MALVNVPIVNSTLANAQLIEKRKQFIINDCEMLRREFEVYGIELSDAVLDLYRKALIVYNANVVWDLKAVSWRMCYQQNYTNGTNKLAYAVPETFNVPIGFKSVDPLTLSFMSLEEFKTLATNHIKAFYKFPSPNQWPVFDNKSTMMSPFSSVGYAEIEANYQAKYGAFNASYFNSINDVPVNQRIYQENWASIKFMFQDRAIALARAFQNPSLEMKSLIPVFKQMFVQNEYQSTGIPFKPIYDFETLHFAAEKAYFKPFHYVVSASSAQYATQNQLLFRGMRGYGDMSFADPNSTWGEAENPDTVTKPTLSETQALSNSYYYPSTDTRSDYQKVFTYSQYSSDQVSTQLNRDQVALTARRAFLNKKFVEDHGGFSSIFQTLFSVVAEAHASVMTPVNILSYDFCQHFNKVLIVYKEMYRYRSDQRPYDYSMQEYKNSAYGTLVETIKDVREIYIFLNNNFKVTASGKDYYMNEKGITELNMNTAWGYKVQIPLDITQPFPYYKITKPVSSNDNKTHLVKTTAFLGIQKLRNGFLYQDIARNFDPTFVNFSQEAIYTLESLVSKQIAIYDLMTDVKAGNIYTKAITSSKPKEPFNPTMPEYETTTKYVDVMKTNEGDMPIVHPEMDYEVKWQHIHAEMVIQSSFFYNNFINNITPVINDYNNRVGSYILKLLEEMKSLSVTYVQSEADKLKAELEAVKLDVAIEKLKSGVFINDNGKEYWRPLLPEEKAEVDKMIARIENNVATEQQNSQVLERNIFYQEKADEAQLIENAKIQEAADREAIELNRKYQEQADLQVLKANEEAQIAADEKQKALNQKVMMEDANWKKVNVDDIVAPSFHDLHKIAKDKDTILSEALIHWENAHPFYTYNSGLAIEINELRNKIIEVETGTLDRLVEAKVNSTNMALALMEIFPEQAKRIS